VKYGKIHSFCHVFAANPAFASLSTCTVNFASTDHSLVMAILKAYVFVSSAISWNLLWLDCL